MEISIIRVDGVHVTVQATLEQVAHDKELLLFAEGLLPKAVGMLSAEEQARWTVADTLLGDDVRVWPFLTALLALDAEIDLLLQGERRLIPLPGFLSYRTRLPAAHTSLQMVRLPPLNPDGYYVLTAVPGGGHIAMRLDIHPKLRVCGHVRLAICGPNRPPQRIQASEHRLERQSLTTSVLEESLTAAMAQLADGLQPAEETALRQTLLRLCTA